MTATVGNDGVVRVGTNTIAELKAWSVTENADRVEDTAMGDSARTYQAGFNDVEGTIECHFDPSDTNGQEALTIGATVSLVLWPFGAGTGNPEWTVSATILGIESSGQINEIIAVTFNWAVASGTLTKGTQ